MTDGRLDIKLIYHFYVCALNFMSFVYTHRNKIVVICKSMLPIETLFIKKRLSRVKMSAEIPLFRGAGAPHPTARSSKDPTL